MTDIYQKRIRALEQNLAAVGLDAALLCEPDSIAYFGGYWNYLGMDFLRPTALLVARGQSPLIVTPLMEEQMCREMAWIDDIRPWEDGRGGEWRVALDEALSEAGVKNVGLDFAKTPPSVSAHLRRAHPEMAFADCASLIDELRMIKDADEISAMKDAGKVAVAMAAGAREVIAADAPEYEIALAVIAAGTRKAAELLGDDPAARFHSPTIYNLQILQSGRDTCLVHRRSSTRRIRRGEPVYLCFCGVANYKNYKLGFDREFFVGEVKDEQARVYEAAIAAQRAALAVLRPGIVAEEVNAAAVDAYQAAGFAPSYRTGRGVGFSFLEEPQLKEGDKTRIQAGMTFAVDGGITVPGEFGGRVGDSVVVTESGYEFLTDYPRELTVL